MLTASTFIKRRIAPCQLACVSTTQRAFADDRSPWRRDTRGDARRRRPPEKSNAPGRGAARNAGYQDAPSNERETPRLIEQLFPERYATPKLPESTREVPKIPAADQSTPSASRTWTPQEGLRIGKGELLRRAMAAQSPETSVLVLRNAGTNLTEEDFRRVMPQGKHLEGWTLEQGDILRVIPGRDLETLEATGDYYLLFSSPLSAFTYQGHVSRIHKLVVANVPSNILSSPIPPPSGYILDGMDAKDAINSFTLLPPDQRIQLRQLRPPLAPAVQSLVKHGGYEQLMQRKERMPHEVRMVLEGPQLHLPFIRHILRTSGKDRGLPWSGDPDGDELPKLTQWEPVPHGDVPALGDKTDSAHKWAEDHSRRGYSPSAKHQRSDEDTPRSPDNEMERRTPRPVYIAGFATERAMTSFVHFWHLRPMAWPGADPGPGKAGEGEGDAPPVASVEVLW